MTIAIVPVAIVRPYNLPYIAMLLVTPGMYHCIMPYSGVYPFYNHTTAVHTLRQLL